MNNTVDYIVTFESSICCVCVERARLEIRSDMLITLTI